MDHDAVKRLYELKQFGEFGYVKPSVTDSSTFTFLKGETMEETFLGQTKDCF